MNESDVLRKFDLLIIRTVRDNTKNIDRSRSCNDLEDFIQEGRIAALKAIRTHEKKRNVKLSTYIVSCVRNRIVDLHRRSRVRPPADCYKEYPYEPPVDSDEFLVENKLSLEKYLNSKNFEMFMPVLLDGSSVADLVKFAKEKRLEKIRKPTGYDKWISEKESREDVVKCLCRVQQILELEDESQISQTSLSLVR